MLAASTAISEADASAVCAAAAASGQLTLMFEIGETIGNKVVVEGDDRNR